MEKEKLEIVLEDICEEVKAINNVMQEQKKQSDQLNERLIPLEVKLNEFNGHAVTDIEPLKTNIIELKELLLHQSRPIIRQWRFVLLPEHYAKEYYQVIFRLIMWLTLVCTLAFLFALGKQSLENTKQVKIKQIENDQYKNAWEYMYKQEKKQGKKKMEEIWQRAGMEK